MSRLLNSSSASGGNGAYTIAGGGGPNSIDTKFVRMISVKIIPSQRWPWRIQIRPHESAAVASPQLSVGSYNKD